MKFLFLSLLSQLSFGRPTQAWKTVSVGQKWSASWLCWHTLLTYLLT